MSLLADSYPPAMTREQVAEVLQVSPGTVWDMCKRGELAAFKVGRRLRIPRSAVESLVEGEPAEDDGRPPLHVVR